ncbi:response regulator transcription factor [Anaeromicropila herbilytica]|uniref:Stage 0 sporulation protein A homolog n=1 Tax=Anaeromicropila herbilytica TaxID=2785025 RepID=A0A7R7IB69_9FIRM|nr:response regulator transcription factor [Anaeromicropila herbilytica]BCN29253.1 DNA-binding response regulator [Anaeromicropila herbilytica]
MKYRIIIIDDDDDLRRLLKRCFENEGYDIETASDGEEGLNKIKSGNYDLIILDIMLPKMNGIEVLEELRKEYIVPVILLSAKEQEMDIVDGLKSGADDYITKPFRLSEIVARVESVLRRCEMMQRKLADSKNEIKDENIRMIGKLLIDKDKCLVMKEKDEILLTSKEYELLCFLSDRPGQIYSKRQIYENVWHEEYVYDDDAIMTLIRRVRLKIEDNPSEPYYIQTIRGLGYRFCKQ